MVGIRIKDAQLFDGYCKIAKSVKIKKLEALKIKASRGVEHRGVEPLTSTMRMSRATICANAPYGFPVFRGSSLDFTVRRSGTRPEGHADNRTEQYSTAAENWQE